MENMEKVVYLDNAATTPCAPEALEMMVKALSGACGNPSSHYSIGYEAKEFVDTGRAHVSRPSKQVRLSSSLPAAAPRPTTGR